MITSAAIAADLRAFGLAEGMSVVVHSSLSSVGHVEGGAGSVIDALLQAIGKTGTLVMPTFTFPPVPVFDPLTTPSTTGLITETFRKRAGVLRSIQRLSARSSSALGRLVGTFRPKC